MSALAQLLMRLLAMQMPCRLFCSAWHLFWHANCSDIYWAFGAPERIRTADPQIRSLGAAPVSQGQLVDHCGNEPRQGHHVTSHKSACLRVTRHTNAVT